MRKTTSKAITVGLATIIIGAAFFLGFFTGQGNATSQPPISVIGNENQPETIDMSLFWQAWNTLDARYVNAASTTAEERVWGAIQGLAGAYGDPYTAFLPPEDAKAFNETIQGNFGGVGMEIGIRDEALTVIAPLKETPAERAGVRAGDRILAINGTSTADISVDRAVQWIRGEVGTTVSLTFFRPDTGATFNRDIERATIQIPTIETELRDDGIFVISIFNFSARAPELFRGALREFAESGSTDMIIDLRGNPGGFLEAAIDMSSWFLPAGKVVVREDFGPNKEDEVHRSKGYDVFTDIVDIVILVDGGSASASEIFAGALQEHGKATVVGSQTFGKGSVQELITLPQDSSLKVTIAKWLTPKGTSISEGGLTPDISVEMTIEDFEADRDPQLDRAVQILLAN